MSVLFEFDAEEAFSELAALADFASRTPELSVEVYRLLNEGTPGLDCEIDSSSASTTGRVVARYKLPERLASLLAAVRAGTD